MNKRKRKILVLSAGGAWLAALCVLAAENLYGWTIEQRLLVSRAFTFLAVAGTLFAALAWRGGDAQKAFKMGLGLGEKLGEAKASGNAPNDPLADFDERVAHILEEYETPPTGRKYP